MKNLYNTLKNILFYIRFVINNYIYKIVIKLKLKINNFKSKMNIIIFLMFNIVKCLFFNFYLNLQLQYYTFIKNSSHFLIILFVRKPTRFFLKFDDFA